MEAKEIAVWLLLALFVLFLVGSLTSYTMMFFGGMLIMNIIAILVIIFLVLAIIWLVRQLQAGSARSIKRK